MTAFRRWVCCRHEVIASFMMSHDPTAIDEIDDDCPAHNVKEDNC